jgi:hypothetical protein
VVGIAKMGDTGSVGRIGFKAFVWFVSASLVSLSLGLVLVNFFEPGVGTGITLPEAGASSGITTTQFGLQEFILHLVPVSIVDGMARNEILQIVVFACLFGFALAALESGPRPFRAHIVRRARFIDQRQGAALAAHRADRQAGDGGAHPACDRRLACVRRGFPDLDERLLDDVFGSLLVAADAEGQPHETRGQLLHPVLEDTLREGLAHQCFIAPAACAARDGR